MEITLKINYSEIDYLKKFNKFLVSRLILIVPIDYYRCIKSNIFTLADELMITYLTPMMPLNSYREHKHRRVCFEANCP